MQNAFLHMDFLSTLFVFIIGCGVLFAALVFIHDKWQSSDAVKRNYPVLAWFRPISEKLGEFFRRYISFSDREELPFNRAVREWVYEAAEGKKDIRGFGTRTDFSARPYSFRSTVFPVNENEAQVPPILTIGPYCQQPYQPPSFFNMSAMSFGSLSAPAVEALSYGTELAGCWLNTGEGGLAPYHLKGNPDIIFEIGTAKYGVRDKEGNLDENKLRELAEKSQIKMFELKLSQGAKPGKGGVLPGCKVTKEIADIRGIAEGEDSTSPNRHSEVKNTEELLDFIAYLRDITGKPVGFKTALGDTSWIKELCAEINKRGVESAPDFITIDGAEGGTGASPMMLMDHIALSIRDALPEVPDILEEYNLRDRIRLIASGKLVTAGDVAWAMASGADYTVSARGFMFSIGCIMAMRCHTDSCPSGVATHNSDLQKALKPQDKKYKVANYVQRVREEVAVIAHSCGVKHCRELNHSHLESLR
ncbi:MAG: FMN-binding glutamate synthase family protein [Micavibrio sp.]|nr:FMN-binding glutamate synthase family protein [Micavibrio sp.]